MKYSFIVPVYNTEKYLKKCLESLINQTYKNFEIVVINDGSTDNSLQLLEKYKNNKKLKIYSTKNNGLSDARNFGITKSSGDYIIFVDSDDYVSEKLLEEIEKVNEDNDLIKFSFLYDRGGILEPINSIEVSKSISGEKAFIELVENKSPFEMAWLYAFKKSFWTSNNFKFPTRKYHEDFATTPLVIIKARSFKALNIPLYYYVQRDGSIINTTDKSKTLKKANDILEHYDNLKIEIQKSKKASTLIKNYFYSYLSNALINKAKELGGRDYKNYIKEINNRKAFDDLMSDNIKRKIKKYLLKVFPSIFIKMRG